MAKKNKLSGDLAGLPASAHVDVIVQFTHAPSAAELATVNGLGGRLKKTFQNIHGALFTLPAVALTALAANPSIAYVSPDRNVAGSLEFAEPTVNAAIALQYGWNGSGVGVAVIDSGIYNPGFEPQNHLCGASRRTIQHWCRLGRTHVAGIVGGNGAMSTGNNYNYTFRGLHPRRISQPAGSGRERAGDSASSARWIGRSH